MLLLPLRTDVEGEEVRTTLALVDSDEDEDEEARALVLVPVDLLALELAMPGRLEVSSPPGVGGGGSAANGGAGVRRDWHCPARPRRWNGFDRDRQSAIST